MLNFNNTNLSDTILKSHTIKLILLLGVILLSACDTSPIKPEPGSSTETRPLSDKQTILSEQATHLLELAEDSDTVAEQLRYRAKAAGLFIEASRIQLAKNQLAIMRQASLESASTAGKDASSAEISLLSAQIAIAEKNTVLADTIIRKTKTKTRTQQIQIFILKADLDFLTGKYMHAVDRRVQLDTYITDTTEKNKNYKKIWVALSNLTTRQLNQQHSKNALINGWLDLAKVMRRGQQNIGSLEDDLLDWGTRHPDHPVGTSFLSELIDNYQFNTNDKKQIAVLLPLNGNFSTIADTIKKGILSAYYNDSNSANKPVIKFYNSSDKSISFDQLYQNAITHGATHFIGPLDKVVINQLAQQAELEIPILTLNYSKNTFNDTKNLYQFGLSPEDEARQVAELAIRQNKFRAAVFYPDSEWGKRLNKAFTEHYEFLGGNVLTIKDYATNSNDYKRPIKALFNLDQSDIRRRKVENLISQRTQSEAYRRQDIDMIFLVATYRSARGIMPAFKFNRAGNLPVYATSHVYTGKTNRELDRDLNGLVFCDLPWVLQNHSPLKKVFTDNWPQQESFTRLFALGIDAYHLIHNLDYLEDNDYAFYDGQTGNIQLNESKRITRKLLWAKFRNGKAVHFEPEIATSTQ